MFVVISVHIPTAFPSIVENITEYGRSERPTAVILKVALEPSDTVCEDGSKFISMSVTERDK